ncbi:hypothetical protein LINGRAHAP2_LOCUS20485 [Linum grandiflorum]
MESKQPRNAMEKVWCKLKYHHSWYVEPKGLYGGLALWWVQDVHINVLRATKHFIHVWWDEPEACFLTFVYGTPRTEDRQHVWEEI